MWPPWLILGFFFAWFASAWADEFQRMSVSLRPWLTLFKPAPRQPFFFFQYKSLPNLFNPLHESLLPALTTSVQPHSPNVTSPLSSFCPPESSLFLSASIVSLSQCHQSNNALSIVAPHPTICSLFPPMTRILSTLICLLFPLFCSLSHWSVHSVVCLLCNSSIQPFVTLYK